MKTLNVTGDQVRETAARAKNLHAIAVYYTSGTDHKPSRVKLVSDRFKETVFFTYSHDFNNTYEEAVNWLMKRGFEIVGKAMIKDGYMILSSTFESLKK